METSITLASHKRLLVHQIREMAELFGFETRNKYAILTESGLQVGFAAEQQKGFIGFLLRHFFGHWRSFNIQFFDALRKPYINAVHPFRLFFQRLEIFDVGGRKIGAVQQRFSILSKRFDVENAQGLTLFEVASPVWRMWTFPFVHDGRTVSTVSKKWSGASTELFTDKDNFLIEYADDRLSEDERKLVLAAALFIDLSYFENKASR